MMEKTINNNTLAETTKVNYAFTDLVEQMASIGMGSELPVQILTNLSIGDIKVKITTSNAAARRAVQAEAAFRSRVQSNNNNDKEFTEAMKLLRALIADANLLCYNKNELVIGFSNHSASNTADITYRKKTLSPILFGKNGYFEEFRNGRTIIKLKILRPFMSAVEHAYAEYVYK